MAEQSPSYSFDDPTLYLFTSLTAGSSHIITATSRLETILKANKIGFRAIDVATDDKARMLWGTRSRGKKLPGLVKHANVLADIEQVEEWNEYGELRAQLHGEPSTSSPVPFSMDTLPKPPTTRPTTTTTTTTSSSPHIQIVSTPSRTPSAQSKQEDRLTLALRQASEEAAAKAKENTRAKLTPRSQSSMQEAEKAVAEKAVTSEEEKPVTAATKTTATTATTTEAKEPEEKKEKKEEKEEPQPSNAKEKVEGEEPERKMKASPAVKQGDEDIPPVVGKGKEKDVATEDKKDDGDDQK